MRNFDAQTIQCQGAGATMTRRLTAVVLGTLVVGLTGCPSPMPPPSMPPLPLPEKSAEIVGITKFRVLPDIRMFMEGTNWVLKSNMVYTIGQTRDSIVVPAGFVTDFASVPPELQSLLSANGPYSYPAIVHDYLYWEQPCTQGEADRIFEIAMREAGVPFVDRWPMYQAVVQFGAGAFSRNAADRNAGLPRVVPLQYRNFGPEFPRWEAGDRGYRRYLYNRGVRPGAKATISPSFCAWGRPGAPKPPGVRP